MQPVIARLFESFPEGFNSAAKAALLDNANRFLGISHADSAHSLKKSVECVRAFFGDDWSQGDVAVLSDPNQGATHVCQLTAVAPLYVDDSIQSWAVVRANVPDLGGWMTGGYSPQAVDRWAEAARFVPAKVLLAGKERRELLDLLQLNSRTPKATKRLALAIAHAASGLDGHVDLMDYRRRFETETTYWSNLIRGLSGKSEKATCTVKIPADWKTSELSVDVAVSLDHQGVKVSLSGPERSPWPLNLTESTTRDIAFAALMMTLGEANDSTDALAAHTQIEIEGTLLAAPVEACVGVGRETTGAAVSQGVVEAVSKLKDIPDLSDLHKKWLAREAQAPLDWQSGTLPEDCRNRLLSIDLEIA